MSRPHSVRTFVVLGAVALSLLFGYREALAAMVHQWNVSPMYSYGFTVPFVSAYLLWTRKDLLATLTPRPSWAIGGLVLLAGLGMTLAGRAGGIRLLEQIAFLVSLAGVVVVLFGVAHLRVGWAALAYLLLMIPMWDGFTESLHEPFQIRSAGIGIWILHALGIPAFRDGTYITLPNLQVEVARVCSGVNYLVAVVALGLPLGYVFLRDNWRRAALLATAVLVAALSNGLRVALICVLAYYEVGSPLHGPFHVLHGLFVAGIGYVVLFFGLRVLGGTVERPQSATPLLTIDSFPTSRVALSTWAAVALVLMFGVTGANLLARPSHPVLLHESLAAVPEVLGAWTVEPGRAVRDTSASSLWPGADVELSRRYRRPDGVVIDVFVAYFASQQQGRELVTYRSTELHNRAVTRRVSAGRGEFDANYVAPDRNRLERLFWYDLDGGSAVNRYAVKGRTLWNIVSGGRSNGAVVVLSTTSAGEMTGNSALLDLAGPLRESLATRLAEVAPPNVRR